MPSMEWNEYTPTDIYLKYYSQLASLLENSPIDDSLATPPKKLKKTILNNDGLIVTVYDDDDDRHRKALFRPSLQSQRNLFVLETMREFFKKNGEIKSVAVMGCGEYSLERFLLNQFLDFGVNVVRSVDSDVNTLIKGFTPLKESIRIVHTVITDCLVGPAVLEQYHGDITVVDNRFLNSDCVCSTEVIEHMPLSEAEKFVTNVLEQIQPRLFILSTPNHEYNAAWDSLGTFRHDDHKFEFTREEFKKWLQKLIPNHSSYEFSVKYVGNLSGYEHLSGATQFAVITRKPHFEKKIINICTKQYTKIKHYILYGAFNFVTRLVCKDAFRRYISENDFNQSNLTILPYGRFWSIDAYKVIDLIQAPFTIKDNLAMKVFLEAIKYVCEGLVVTRVLDMRGTEACIIIPESTTMEKIVSILNRKSICLF